MPFCSNCGKELTNEAKFCPNCGTATILNNDNTETRKTVYEGEIHKCPNCGETLNSFIANCPTCGFELRGTKSSRTLNDFFSKLVNIELEEQKIELIRNFPIPNTKEDIWEFLILASSNIDIDASTTIQKELTAAWLTKIEQSYKKAKLLFFNDDDFLKIQSIYSQTCGNINEINKTEKKKYILKLALRTIGLWCGLLIFFIAFIIDILTYIDTSIYHLSGATVMIVGAFMIGRKSKDLLDVGIGIGSGIISIILGTILQEVFFGNGSLMELAGATTIIIVVIRLVITYAKSKH